MHSPKCHERVLAHCNAEYSVGCADEMSSNRQALLVVCLKDFFFGLTSDHKRQLPRQVVCVLQASVHSLSARGRVDMCSISSEKAPASAKVRNITMMRMVQRNPLRVGKSNVHFQVLSEISIDLIERNCVFVGIFL